MDTGINLGRPTGPRLRNLTVEQERLLSRWLTMALVSPPDKREDLPVDYTRALGEIAKRRGIRFKFSGDSMRVRGAVVLGRNVPGCIGGSRRTVVVTDQRQVVAKSGRAVEPWNMHNWRE